MKSPDVSKPSKQATDQAIKSVEDEAEDYYYEEDVDDGEASLKSV